MEGNVLYLCRKKVNPHGISGGGNKQVEGQGISAPLLFGFEHISEKFSTNSRAGGAIRNAYISVPNRETGEDTHPDQATTEFARWCE